MAGLIDTAPFVGVLAVVFEMAKLVTVPA